MAADMHFIAELPAGYDERTRMALRDDNQVIITHPEHPPLLLQPNGQWVAIGSTLVHRVPRSSNC